MPELFSFFGFLFFFVFLVFEFWIFGFYIAKPKVQTTKTTNIQKNKKTKLRRHSP